MIRPAEPRDGPALAELAGALAQTYPLFRPAFNASFEAVLTDPDACLLVALDGDRPAGYLLGFRHLTFFANGRIGAVEEIMVAEPLRGRGVGRALMAAFEQWALDGNCALVALATRRAAAFYRALGYEESAAYFRKPLTT